MKTVSERLTKLGNLYKERNKLYKDNYKRFGDVLIAMFPDGIHLTTAEEMNRFALFLQLVHKLTRYARSIKPHADSLDDLTVYAQMLREYDDDTNL